MINKKNLWFLTLFCLILVLSVYYITMPSELLMTTNSDYVNATITEETNEPTVTIEESNILTALRIEAEEQVGSEIEQLQAILVNADATVDEKNNAYEKIKDINNVRSEEQKLEKQIMETYNLKSFVKINGDQIRVVVATEKHDNTIANNIMRTIQNNYETSKYISVKFQV
ncbi:MAG: SpoIIIAH-like family protein [Bacilli bacterium]|nr:SpoIIIAH-like family protein [Bacilli bacterium]